MKTCKKQPQGKQPLTVAEYSAHMCSSVFCCQETVVKQQYKTISLTLLSAKQLTSKESFYLLILQLGNKAYQLTAVIPECFEMLYNSIHW